MPIHVNNIWLGWLGIGMVQSTDAMEDLETKLALISSSTFSVDSRISVSLQLNMMVHWTSVVFGFVHEAWNFAKG